MQRILIINPGSTSTKLALYDDDREVFTHTVRHTDEELEGFFYLCDQLEFRKNCVLSALDAKGIPLSSLTCIAARGGQLPPCSAGAYEVDERMVDYMMQKRAGLHISGIACAVAYAIGHPLGLPCYIYDPVSVDELSDVARITGIPELPKESRGHALNTRAMARKCADEILHKPLDESTIIVQHLGGGVSVWLYQNGRAVDMYSDDDAGFGPERCGRVQAAPFLRMATSGRYTKDELSRKLRGNAGIKAYLGTSDAREVERRIKAGDDEARAIYEAFAYSTAKGIGDLAAAARGKVDAIVLTGGIAYSAMVTDMIREYIDWIAPVHIMAGEYEMEALAAGALRVMEKREEAMEFPW